MNQLPYELIDMVLLSLGDIDIIMDLHRTWVGKYLLESWYIPVGKLFEKALKDDNVKFIRFLYDNHDAMYTKDTINEAYSNNAIQIVKYLNSIGLKSTYKWYKLN